jgi:hypothetical protein
MTTWTRTELDKIATADELQIVPLRRDGALRKPVTIWVVRVGDDLYVRSAYGRGAAWFRGVKVRREARIQAGGVEKDVIFIDADPTSTTRSTPRIAPSTADIEQPTST